MQREAVFVVVRLIVLVALAVRDATPPHPAASFADPRREQLRSHDRRCGTEEGGSA